MKYLIGLDLDGTLLTDDKKITQYNKEVISKLISKGHEVFLVTGRSYDGAINYYNELKLNTPLITLNGALTTNKNESRAIYLNDDFSLVLKKIKPFIISAFFNSKNLIYTYKYEEELELIFNGGMGKNYEEIDFNKTYNNILNGVVCIKEGDDESFLKHFENTDYGARFWVSHEGISYYDLYNKEISKATAIKELLTELNYSKDNLITIGDGVNDTEMLSMTKHGTAMKNGSLEVKAFASNTTDYDNQNDGVGKYLSKLLLK